MAKAIGPVSLTEHASTPKIVDVLREGDVMMKTMSVLSVVVAGLVLSSEAESFINLDFEQANIAAPGPFPGTLPWEAAAPGWEHSAGDSTEYVYYLNGHLGYSQSYILFDAAHSVFGPVSGAFAMMMRSGSFREHVPRGEFVNTFLAQTGMVPFNARTLRLLSNNFHFEASIDDVAIDMLPVGLDHNSPNYAEDRAVYRGEFVGDISSFAGRVAELKILNTYPSEGESSSKFLTIDNIRFVPLPEPASGALISLGVAVLLLRAIKRREDKKLTGHASAHRRHLRRLPFSQGTSGLAIF